jgi:hypothetical protein
VWFKHRAWIPVAWLLSLGNLIAVWFAAQPAEPWHATIHALLAVGFGLGAQRLRQRSLPAADEELLARLQELEARLVELDESQDMAGRLAQLEERLDFAERALVDARNRAQIPLKE